MPKVLVLYYSSTGNTEKMAHAVIEGLKILKGINIDIKYYVDAGDLAAYDAIVIGIPTHNHDMPIEIKRILEEAATKNVDLRGKVGAAFGSYGWSGEAPGMVIEIMESRLGMHVVKPPLAIKGSPDRSGLEKCKELGIKVAEEVRAKATAK
ncbi:MAG: flavodoxin domain-containing protein [Candidatus Bathyarchaeia archaeon]